MSETLTNVIVGDNYTNAAALGPALDVSQLVFQVFNEPVYARFFKPQPSLPGQPENRGAPTLDPVEHYFPVGTLLSVDGCAGAQWRNAIAGQPATVNAVMAFVNDPTFDFQSSGLFSAAVLTLSFLHNNTLIGAESALDFEDSAQIAWTVTDTPGTKEAVSAAFVAGSVVTSVFGRTGAVVAVSGDYTAAQVTNAADKSSASQQLFTGDVGTGAGSIAVGAAAGSDLHTTGTVASAVGSTAGNCFTATVTGDTTGFRWTVTGDGTLHWGPGNAALDTALSRSVTGPPSSTGGPFLSTANSYLVTSATGYVAATATNNQVFASYFSAADANPAFKIFAQGALAWGAGGASALDLELARIVNSSGGTGTFLELISGQGFGYGTGTGGTTTQTTSFNTAPPAINKACGVITLFTSATVAGTVSEFTVSNSVVGANDVVIVSWGTGVNTGALLSVSNVAAGSFKITWEAVQSNASSTRTINFAVIKGAAA